jgi:diadenosine tetraphosphate (Ap4A) HIT family hydrolase
MTTTTDAGSRWSSRVLGNRCASATLLVIISRVRANLANFRQLRNRDSIDYHPNDATCLFCRQGDNRVIGENGTCYARFDNFPASKGHIEIVPKRHVASLFALTPTERADALALLFEVHSKLEADYCPDGYTIGVNEGEAAGRSIPHLHIHLIPRYRGDVEDPRGGIRQVVPNFDPDAWLTGVAQESGG